MQHNSRHRPAFGIDVPEDFYWSVEAACGGAFADSYLFGGEVHNGRFVPRTLTGWEKLRENFNFMKALESAGLTLIKPRPYDGPPAWQILGHDDPNAEKPKRRKAYRE
jgi:hypothetical protein